MKPEFKTELVKLLQIKDKLLTDATLSDATNLASLDSLGVTELCLLFEEHYGVEVSFEQMRGMKIVGDLWALLPKDCEAHKADDCGCPPEAE